MARQARGHADGHSLRPADCCISAHWHGSASHAAACPGGSSCTQARLAILQGPALKFCAHLLGHARVNVLLQVGLVAPVEASDDAARETRVLLRCAAPRSTRVSHTKVWGSGLPHGVMIGWPQEGTAVMWNRIQQWFQAYPVRSCSLGQSHTNHRCTSSFPWAQHHTTQCDTSRCLR